MSGANPLSQLGPFWRDREFWRDVGRNTQQVAGGLTAGALGAPVDIASAVVRPFAQLSGYSMPPESVVGSSDWFGKKMGHDTGSIPWMVGSIGPVPDGVDAARLAGSLDKLGPLAAIGMSRMSDGVLPYVGSPDRPAGAKRAYESFVENVAVDDLLAMRGNTLGKTDLKKLKAEIQASGGLREPVIIQVGKNSRTAIVGEGNHRVQAAKELGYDYVPARVLVQRETHGSLPAPQRDDLIPEPGAYFPSDAKPSDVFRRLGIAGRRENAARPEAITPRVSSSPDVPPNSPRSPVTVDDLLRLLDGGG